MIKRLFKFAIFFPAIILLTSCAYYTIGRTVYIYPNIYKSPTDSSHFTLDLKLGKSKWTEKYFASDTVSDSIYSIENPLQRKEALKKLNYSQIGASVCCGIGFVDFVKIPDSSKFKIIGISYIDAKHGHIFLNIKRLDTGYTPIFIQSGKNTINTGLTIKKDTLSVIPYSSHTIKRYKGFLPLLYLFHLCPFWP